MRGYISILPPNIEKASDAISLIYETFQSEISNNARKDDYCCCCSIWRRGHCASHCSRGLWPSSQPTHRVYRIYSPRSLWATIKPPHRQQTGICSPRSIWATCKSPYYQQTGVRCTRGLWTATQSSHYRRSISASVIFSNTIFLARIH